MSKTVTYTCDYCLKPIDGTNNSSIAGGGEVCTLIYQGLMAHNQFPMDGFHYHYGCFLRIVRAIKLTAPDQPKADGGE